MGRLLRSRRVSLFFIILAVVYLVVWVIVFHKGPVEYEDSEEVDDDDEDGNEDGNEDVRLLCECAPQEGSRDEQILKTRNQKGTINDTVDVDTNVNIGRYERYKPKPFLPDEPKMVLIFAYQRVGSSFIGQIFDQNPDIFYVYEPLDSLYQSMYGTASGHNIPSDITSFKNGSDRILPIEERAAVSTFLHAILSCDIDTLPSEFFVHSFWHFLAVFMPSWNPYLECLTDANLTYGRRPCADHFLKCPKRFGSQPWHSLRCKEQLWGNSSDQRSSGGYKTPFKAYRKCMDKVRHKANSCIKIMKDKCTSTQFRAAKTVRATMSSVESLIRNNQNLRIVHLIRDPRPVAASRMATETYHGLYAKNNNTVREATLYCNILVRDLLLRKQLQVKYPGTFFEVIYEDFVKQPAEYAQAIYKFLDMGFPETLLPWLESKTRGSIAKNVTQARRTPKWKKKLTVDQAEQITATCQNFYELSDFDFH